MELKKGYTFLYVLSALFIAANMYFIYNESFVFGLFPYAIILGFLAFFSLDKLLLIIMFFVPISVELSEFMPGTPVNMSLPTEPFLFVVMCMFFLKLMMERRFDKKILSHPITISIYVYLAWILFTTLTSQLPIVSFKYFLSRVWFIVCFYFLVTQLVVDKKNISKYIWAYTFGMLITIAYTVVVHAESGFAQKTANYAMNPIFRDHTSYGAALALIIPGIFVLMKFARKDFNVRFMYGVVLFILFGALVLSYTRAAWIGIAAIIAIWVVIKLKIKFRTLLVIGLFFTVMIVPVYNDILHKMSKNSEVSSSDIGAHVKSMSNISTDASNLERINRWKCAIRMFELRPVLGWGPGTYMFLYAPFQNSQDKTIISTNAGNMGNAHSEYLGLLAEAGVFGTLSFLAIILTTLIVGFRLYHQSQDEFVREITLFLLLGLITYYLHAFLNNFLDMDKIASLFWGYMAIIVALDVYQNNQTIETKIEHETI